MGVNSLPKTVTRQRRDCDLNPGPSAPESSMLITRLLSHPLLLTACGVFAIKEKNREVSIGLNMPTDESPVTLTIKLANVLPAEQCLQLYGITFRRYVLLISL